MRGRIGTVLGVVAAVVIAWIVVDVAFSLLWFLWRLVIVAVVAALVYVALRSASGRRRT